MSVLVRVFGAKPESDEYQCALVLKKKFEEYFSPDVVGEIFIQAKDSMFLIPDTIIAPLKVYINNFNSSGKKKTTWVNCPVKE